MKKLALFTIIPLICAGIIFLGCRQRGGARVGNIDLTKVQDGNYGGNAVLAGNLVVVKVTVKFHKITDILVARALPGDRGRLALLIIARVMEKQTLSVPLIEGAEQESRAILKAIENALKSRPRPN